VQLATLLTLGGALVPLEAALLYRRLRRGLAPVAPPELLPAYPSLTVIRPVRGVDAGAADNLAAALATRYPGPLEQLFVVDDETEPALPLIRAAIATSCADARVLLCGAPPAGVTGKLNAMVTGLREARHQLIAFADSDIRPDPDALTILVATLLRTPDAGAAFAPVLVQGPPETVGDAGYGLMLNGLYGPAAATCAAANGGELPFIMGQLMVFTRRTLSAIGGLESAAGQLVDDMYLGARVKAVGLRNVLAPRAVPVIQHGLSLREFLRIYVRWITFSRTGLPGREFKLLPWLQGVCFWCGLLLLLIGAASQALPLALVGLLGALAVSTSVNALYAQVAGAPLPRRLRWVAFALLFAAPVVFFLVLTRREVTWRGRSYPLDRSARLAGP